MITLLFLLSSAASNTNRACYSGYPHSTRLRCAAILHRLCVSVPAASIGLGRIMPELLLLHLEADGGCLVVFLRGELSGLNAYFVWSGGTEVMFEKHTGTGLLRVFFFGREGNVVTGLSNCVSRVAITCDIFDVLRLNS